MRNLRVVNLSMKTLAINMLAWSALSAPASAQSFDYPAGSPSLIERGLGAAQNNPEKSVPSAGTVDQQAASQTRGIQQPAFQAHAPQNFAKPSMFSKLFSRRSKSTQPTFASPYVPAPAPPVTQNAQAYDTQSSVYVNSAKNNQTHPVVTQASVPLNNDEGVPTG